MTRSAIRMATDMMITGSIRIMELKTGVDRNTSWCLDMDTLAGGLEVGIPVSSEA